MSGPFVSVIIPTYNRASLLEQALASILCQTYLPSEILVIDDGSTDDTYARVRAFGNRVRYLFQKNRGPAAARNLGLDVSRGDVIAFLDADDLWMTEALEWRLARLQDPTLPRAEVVLGLTQRAPLANSSPGTIELPPPNQQLLFGAMLTTRDVFALVGLLDTELRYGEDMDWFMRLQEKGIAVNFIAKPTLTYRLHADNLMSNPVVAKQYLLRAVQKSIARRSTTPR